MNLQSKKDKNTLKVAREKGATIGWTADFLATNTEVRKNKWYFNMLKENYSSIYDSILKKLLSIMRIKIKTFLIRQKPRIYNLKTPH